jgi:hypothetical protein
MSFSREVIFLAVICSAQLLTQMGFSMTLSAMYIIGDSFDGQGSGVVSWYAAAYSLTVGKFAPPVPKPPTKYGQERSSSPPADSAMSTATRKSLF